MPLTQLQQRPDLAGQHHCPALDWGPDEKETKRRPDRNRPGINSYVAVYRRQALQGPWGVLTNTSVAGSRAQALSATGATNAGDTSAALVQGAHMQVAQILLPLAACMSNLQALTTGSHQTIAAK
jgi:hypothetical protein